MLRVLHINAGSQNFGGVSAILLNLYRHMDRKRVQFDFLTPNRTTYEMHREEIEAMGGHIYELGVNSSNFTGKMKLYAALREFFRTHRYDIVHVNSGILLFNCFAASAAKRFTRAKVFVHAHANGGRTEAKERLSEPLKKFLVARTDVSLACSPSAAAYIFTKDEAENRTVILRNGIDAGRFAFSAKRRESLRQELGLGEAPVLGCVGRFSPEKNHGFLLEILKKAREISPSAALLLVGSGPLFDEIRGKAEEMGLSEAVIFAGAQADVAPWYDAMDVYLQPSEFEGFGICCLEAEASGLSVIASDGVPEDADARGVMKRIPLDLGAEAFAREALALAMADKNREMAWECVGRAGYDITRSADRLMELYEAAAGKRKS